MTSQLASLLGAVRPRVELRPDDAVDTFGPDAVELAAMGGIVCEQWQADGLDILLGVRADGKWAAREYAELVGRQEGKSIGIGLPRCLYGMLVLRERLIMWSAHEYKTSMESFLQARTALQTLGEDAGPNTIAIPNGDGPPLLVKVNNTNGEEGFELFELARLISRWRFLARSKGSGRGFSGDVNVIDEAFAYTRAHQSALAPTMLARPNPQTVYLSSPPLDGKSGDVLYALAERALARAKRLGYRDWGLAVLLDELQAMPEAERKAFLADRGSWAASLPALGRGRVDEEDVEQLLAELDDLDFAREVVGCWPKQIGAAGSWEVISEEDWTSRGSLTVDDRPSRSIVFVADGSWPDAKSAAIVVAGLVDVDLGEVDEDGDPVLVERVSLQVIEHRPGTEWVLDRLRELFEEHPDAVAVLDRKGPLGFLADDVDGLGFEVVFPTAEDVAHAYGRFVAEASGPRGRLLHYGQAELAAAVRAAGTRPIGDARTWARKGDADISPLTAGTLAVAEALERDNEPWVITT